jgi:hypothetical protein
MRKIPLSKGMHATVDDEDFLLLDKHRWYYHHSGYAVRHAKKKDSLECTHVHMHRVILGLVGQGLRCDHIDGDRLNNARNNLRVATHRQNMQNITKPKSSKYPGVTFHASAKKWQAMIYAEGHSHYIGLFNNEEAAFRAYGDRVQTLGETMIGGWQP